jgi:FkbM family methyltransferase
MSALRLALGASKGEAVRLANGATVSVTTFMGIYILDEVFFDRVYALDINARNIIDIGANIRLFTLYAKSRWPNAKILAFEPEGDNFAALSDNVRKNSLASVECFRLGVSAGCGTVDLFKHPKNSGGHSIHYHHGNAVSIETVNLDWILNKFDGEVDLLKMDCEGCEREILFRLTAVHAMRIRHIIFESESRLYSFGEATAHLESLGYRVKPHGTLILAAR